MTGTAQGQRSNTTASRSPLRQRRALSWEAIALLAVILIALGLRLWPINGASREYDEGVYWLSLRAMAHGFPLFSSVFSSQPPLFLLSLYPFYLIFGQALFAARLGVVVYSLVGLLAIYWSGRVLGGRWCGVLAALLLAADPLYLAQSVVLEAEIPALAGEILCVALAIEATRRSGRSRRLFAALSGVALVAGTLIKLFDVAALAPALLYLTAPFCAAFVTNNGRLRRPDSASVAQGLRLALPDLLAFLLGAAVTCVIVLVPFAAQFGAVYDQAVRFHLAAAHTVNEGTLYNIKLITKTGSEYPLAILALVAIGLAVWRRAWTIVPPTIWFLVSLLLLVRQQPLFSHHITLLVPPLALIGALALPLLLTWNPSPIAQGLSRAIGSAKMSALLILVVIVVFVGVTIGVNQDRLAARPISQNAAQMADALNSLTLPTDVVVVDDQYIAGLADRPVPPQLVDTSMVRIQSGYLTASQLEYIITHDHVSAVLFSSGRFDLIPGFRVWVQSYYANRISFGPRQTLYYSKAPAGPSLALRSA